MIFIISLFLNVLIGSAFVCDAYFRRIPNWLILTGLFFLFPFVFYERGIYGVFYSFYSVFMVGLPLFTMYMLGALGAGDVKLLCLVCGTMSVKGGIEFVFIVLVIGTVIGLMKKMVIGNFFKKKRTTVRFSVPVLLGYIWMTGI